jgi:ethanolamine utilization protein EutA
MSPSLEEKFYSVGIDIGTTTTQFVLSELRVKNIAPGSLVPRMMITDKTILYKSPLRFTPFQNTGQIDTEEIFRFIEQALKSAGVSQSDIHSGAVIITGETAKKENAQLVSEKVADYTGDFVVATAGGKLEGIIAGKGSGACAYSKAHSLTVANIDIGGGTANIGIFSSGAVIDSSCINIGGRLLELDSSTGAITHITEPMAYIIKDLGLTLKKGDTVTLGQIKAICERMAALVWDGLFHMKGESLTHELTIGAPLRFKGHVDALMFSGGVADYIYKPLSALDYSTVAEYGDIGPLLGTCIAAYFKERLAPLLKPLETIRATVIGAGTQILEVSGSTISVEDALLPLKNIPVIHPFASGLHFDVETIAETIQRLRVPYMTGPIPEIIAIGVMGDHVYRFSEIQSLAQALVKSHSSQDIPLIAVLQQDAAKVLGQTIRTLAPHLKVICIDQIKVDAGDYIDIGKSIARGTVVPLVIKTLVFSGPHHSVTP